MPLRNRRIVFALLVTATLFPFCQAASAQIASYVDQNRRLIYVNGDSPHPSRGSSIKGPATTQSLAASAAGSSMTTDEFTATSPNPTDSRLDRIVQEAARRHRLDPALVKAVISTESGWNTQAISQKGAVGLMQLVPATAQRFGVGNPFDPAQNIEGGTMYLKSLLDRYNGDLIKTLAAYNAGEHTVDLSHGVPAYRETRRYVRKVTNAYFRPGSGRTSTLWSPPRPAVRQEVDANGRVVFTNE
jgi:soluble lytic murein transglycosylase-like protein